MRPIRLSRLSSLLLSALLIAAPVSARSQAADHAVAARGTSSRLSLFTRLAGEWEGEAKFAMGAKGWSTSRQHETVEAVAGGTAFSIKGLGTTKGADGADRITHDAFGIVFLDHDGTTPKMRAFVAQGANWIDPDFTLTPTGYVWSMTDARVGLIRYEMSFDAQGRWVEKGVMSRDDGKTWMPFFEMTLVRTK